MALRCEDYPCCGHTPSDPCDYSGPTSSDMLANPARYHLGCDHEVGCEYEADEDYEDEDEDEREDYEDHESVDADSYVLASAGWGTDEDYGHFSGYED